MRRWLVLLPALFLLPLFLGPAEAATPSSGTIGPENPTVAWEGQYYAAGATLFPEECPPEADPANALCDHFFLTVSAVGAADIQINWPSADDDFDLYVYDDDTGALVGFSAQGGTTSERVLVPNATAGKTYEVRVNPFLVTDSAYDGSATFVPAEEEEPNPRRPTGGLGFGPATVIDAQRTEGEPLNFIDEEGNYWESGPWGTSTQNSFVHRSTDGGAQFNIVSPIGLRPDAPPGGGDTDVVVDDQGFAYFVDLEGLVNLGVAVSNDDGNTWRKNAFAVQETIDDRQWFALDNGPTAAAVDNTVFLAFRQIPLGSFIYSTPGSTGTADPVGGLVYQDASSEPDPLSAESTGAPCGQLWFDSLTRNLYYPCSKGDHVEITVGHVEPGQRTGIEFRNIQAPASPGGGPVGDIFPRVTTDRAGNLYAVWVDETDHNVYYAASSDAGTTWGPVFQVNGDPANTNVFPWAVAGANGTLAVAWYGNDTFLDSDDMPSWYNDRRAATAFKWFGYVAVVKGAAGSSPSFVQTRFAAKPMHYGQICNQGLGCTLSGGDRTMADFFAIDLDLDGSVRVVYNDTTSQHHGAHLFEARQIGGPSLLGGRIKGAAPRSPVADPTGDAQTPHYAPVVGPGPSLPRFDFTRLELSQPNRQTLRVQMTLNDLDSLLPPPGKTSALWLTRFQALSLGDGLPPEGPEESFRIFYVGAESVGGGPPTFFAGSGESAQEAVPGNGCTTTTAENCKIVQYPNEFPAEGRIAGDTITIDVKIQGGFGPDRPIKSGLFYVTALSGGRDGPADIYTDIDATRSFDFALKGR